MYIGSTGYIERSPNYNIYQKYHQSSRVLHNRDKSSHLSFEQNNYHGSSSGCIFMDSKFSIPQGIKRIVKEEKVFSHKKSHDNPLLHSYSYY